MAIEMITSRGPFITSTLCLSPDCVAVAAKEGVVTTGETADEGEDDAAGTGEG